MSTTESGTKQFSPASDDTRFQFLQTQISYVTSHLQIADAKAAGVIAFISVLSGYTANKVSLSAGPPFAFGVWLAVMGVGSGLGALAVAFLAVMPRGWPGRDPKDQFSWVGLSSATSSNPYSERLSELTKPEMQRSLADTVETCSLIISRKYWLVSASLWASMIATALQGASWLMA